MPIDVGPDTALVALEKELRLHRELVAGSGEGVYRLDFEPPVPVDLPAAEQVARMLASGRVASANDRMAGMYGFATPDELVGRPIAAMLVPDHPATLASLHRFVAGGHRYRDVESVEVDRDGRERIFLNSAVGVVEAGHLIAAWGSQRDLTEERRTLELLRQSEQRFALAFRANPGALSISTLADGRFVDVNEAFAQNVGLPREQLIGATGVGLGLWAAPEERELVTAAVRQHGFARRVPARVRRADGEPRSALISAMTIEIGGERCLLTLSEDVTESEQVAAALAQSQARFRAAVEGSLDAFLVFDAVRDAGGRIEDFALADLNRRAEELLGRPRPELLGRRLGELQPGGGAGLELDKLVRVCATGKAFDGELEVAFPGRRPRWIHQQVVPLAAGVAIWVRDVSERRLAEEERRRHEREMLDAQRLEALGLLAGGIAHDFNNLLTGIQGYAELARRKVRGDEAIAPLVDEILVGVRRATELTQKMLAFAGGGTLEVAWIGLNEVVSEMSDLVRAAVPRERSLRLELARPGPGLEADATLLRQVVLNLLVNASEAIEGGAGTVVATTGECWVDRERLERAAVGRDQPEGRYAFLAVADDGCGMSREVQARIFDPFFSTKFTGRGLGLAAVLGIVRAHRGAIEIDSAPGRGSRFTVLLPLAIQGDRPRPS